MGGGSLNFAVVGPSRSRVMSELLILTFFFSVTLLFYGLIKLT